MSTTLIVDTMDETTVRVNAKGWSAVRTAILLNVTGSASAIVYNATQDALLTANNLYFGQVHPTLTALYCDDMKAVAIDTNKVKITSTYSYSTVSYLFASNTQNALLSMGASVQGTQTNLDINGTTMTVAAPSNYTPPSGAQTTQGGTVQVDAATVVLTFTRRETGAPTPAVLLYENTINQYSCSIAGAVYPANTLKLDRINAAPVGTGVGVNNYLCTYEFAYNPATWVTTIAYIDPVTNTPAINTSTGAASTATFWNYTKVDFSFLYLW